ncbi:MAG: hypothetical protein N2C12_10575, partial [Planctomycetales bacterium]
MLRSTTNGYGGTQTGNLLTPPPVQPRGGMVKNGGNVFGNVGGASSAVLTPEATLFFGLTNEIHSWFGYIEALNNKGVVTILATPTLMTISGRPAEFLVGGEQPFPTAQGAIQTPSVEFKKFGTRLNFLPIILGHGKIRLDLVPEVSTVNFGAAIDVGGIVVPQFITQRLHTTVEMEEGQMLVLGGLLQTEMDSQVTEVPILGRLPIVGMLFRRVRNQVRETELLVLVRPRLVHPIDKDQMPPLLPGQETDVPNDSELYLRGLPEADRVRPPHVPQPNHFAPPQYHRWEPHPAPPVETVPIPKGSAPKPAPAGVPARE